MSIQTKLANSAIKRKRKLYDLSVKLTGYEAKVIRLEIQKDKYDNEEGMVVGHEIITAYFDYPGDTPLYLNKSSAGAVSPVGSFIYDNLPVQAYFTFNANINDGDIIIRKFNDAIENEKVFIHAFKVLEQEGTFSTALIMKKYNLVPYELNFDIYPGLYDIVDQFEGVV